MVFRTGMIFIFLFLLLLVLLFRNNSKKRSVLFAVLFFVDVLVETVKFVAAQDYRTRAEQLPGIITSNLVLCVASVIGYLSK